MAVLLEVQTWARPGLWRDIGVCPDEPVGPARLASTLAGLSVDFRTVVMMAPFFKHAPPGSRRSLL